ncbi:MAG: LytR C-terminal domain-containing protein [bacterium]|nr:LytR C-terminal domain-containing protein [bacterium]
MPTVVTVLNNPAEAALSARIRSDLTGAGFQVTDTVQPGKDTITLYILSAAAAEDAPLQEQVVHALENNQHLLPVLAANVPLPRLINHLQPLDFSQRYDAKALVERLNKLSAPDAPPPLVVLTPRKRDANRRVGIALGVLIAVVLVVSVWGMLAGLIGFPEEEYRENAEQEQRAINFYIDNALPRDSQQAQNFPVTIEAMPTMAQQPLIATATAIANGVQGTFVPRTTDDATNFPATLQWVATVVRDELIGTATAQASGQ